MKPFQTRALVFAVLVLAIAGGLTAAEAPDAATAAKLKDFDAWMNQTLKDWNVPGIGVGIVVIGGASPAPNVCWLVGPRGTVTLTIDGRVWQRLTFPEMIDLINVHATDDRHATVTALDGRSFVTNDRGASWTQVAKD